MISELATSKISRAKSWAIINNFILVNFIVKQLNCSAFGSSHFCVSLCCERKSEWVDRKFETYNPSLSQTILFSMPKVGQFLSRVKLIFQKLYRLLKFAYEVCCDWFSRLLFWTHYIYAGSQPISLQGQFDYVWLCQSL